MWRKEDNNHYTAAQTKNLDVKEKEKKLQSDIYTYQRAMDQAGGDFRDEYSSAAKNYAMTPWRLAELFCGKEGKLALSHYCYSMAFEYFGIAAVAGKEWKTVEWKEHLESTYFNCVKEALVAVQGEDKKDRVKLIESYIGHMREGSTFKADCYMEMATVLFKMSVIALQVSELTHILSVCLAII